MDLRKDVPHKINPKNRRRNHLGGDGGSSQSRITITVVSTSITTAAPFYVMHLHLAPASSDRSTSTNNNPEEKQRRQVLLLLSEGIDYQKNGQYSTALEAYHTVLKSQHMLLKRSPFMAATTLANLGSVYLYQGRYHHAEKYRSTAVDIVYHLQAKNNKNKNKNKNK